MDKVDYLARIIQEWLTGIKRSVSMTLEWDSERMATGQPLIDAQHREWIQRFNQFDAAVLMGEGEAAVKETLEFLTRYANIHFANEEEMMARLKVPALEANRNAHAEFRAKLSEIRHWVEQSGPSSVEVVALKMDLEKWVEEHICTIDVQLRDCEK